MGWTPDPRARWRAKAHDGTSLGRDADGVPPYAPREITITFYPMRDTTLAAVLVRSRAGDARWDRREGTLVCEVPAESLWPLDTPGALVVLLRSALSSLT